MPAKPMFGKPPKKHSSNDKSVARDMLYVVDGNNFLHRAKHAMKGKPIMWDDFDTSIMRGFLNILSAEYLKFQPTHVGIVFDGDGDGFRKDLWPTYKANRESRENALKGIIDNTSITMRESMNNLRDLMPMLGLQCLQLRDVEGDDVIGSIVGLTDDLPTIMSTNDKDMLQLVTKRIHLLSTHWGMVGPQRLRELLGIKPKQVVDYLALMGDDIDNYPGVRGIGKQFAVRILTEFGTVRDFLAQVKKDNPLYKWKAKIEDSDFKIFRQLAKLAEYDLSVPEYEDALDIDDFAVQEPDRDGIAQWCENFGINKYPPIITKALGLTEGRVKRMF